MEQSVLVGERSYCVGCFVCGVCGAALAGKYYEVEGVVSCQQCRWGTLVFVLIFTINFYITYQKSLIVHSHGRSIIYRGYKDLS